MKALIRLLLFFLALVGASGMPVGAAAPYGWVRPDGRPFVWNTSQPIPYSVDQGTLGRLSNSEATTLVQTAFQRWDDVDTAAISFAPAAPLTQDITGANVLAFLNNLAPGTNPVIFDNDGSVMKALLGDATAAVALGRPLTNDPASGTITGGFVVLNGLFIDSRFTPDDLSLTDYRGMAVQEIGRFLGLGYSQLNTDLIADGIVDNNRLVPQMYPQGVPGSSDQLTVDDRAAISALYPAPNLAATTATVRGQVLLPDAITGLQGINVVARRVGDPTVTAVSAISGMRFRNEIGGPGMDGSRQVALRGAYELVGLPPGSYTINIEALQPDSLAGPLKRPAFLPGGTQYYRFGGTTVSDPALASQLNLAAGQVLENLSLILNVPGGPAVQNLVEQEPNQFPEQAQSLPLAAHVQGSIGPNDPSGVSLTVGSASVPVPDLYRLTLPQPTILTATLSAAVPNADLNLYLLAGAVATAPRVVASSTDPGTPPESFQLRLPAGIYILGVSSVSGPSTAYVLDVNGTAAPDPTTPPPPTPRLNNLLLVNVTTGGATARFASDQPSNTLLYVTNPLIEFSSPTPTTDHIQSLSGLAPGTAYRLQAIAVVPPGGAVGTLPDLFFTTAQPALPGGVGQISAGVADVIDDPDDPKAVFVVLSFRNVGTGDASGVTINSLNAPAGWAFSNPLPLPLGLGFVGRGASGVVLTRVVQTGTAGPSIASHLAPVITGSGTYFSPGVGQQPFGIGGPVSTLNLQKSVDPASARPGELVTFTLTATNSAQGSATGVVVSDNLPQGLAFVDASAGGQFQNGAVFWNLGTLAPNQPVAVSFRARLAGNLASGVTLTNVALIRSNEATSPLASNVAPVGVAVPPPPPPQLQLTKTAGAGQARPGDTVTFTLSYANTGGSPATNVVLTDTLPPGQILADAGGGTPSGSTVSWDLGALQPGETGSRTLGLQIAGGTPTGTQVTNSAQITAGGLAAVSSTATVQVTQTPLLQLSKTANRNSARPGDTITYTLTLTNSGGTATNVQILDPVPTGTVFVSAPNGSLQNGTVVWNVSPLASGFQATVSLSVQVQSTAAALGTISNTAQARSAEVPNGIASNNVGVAVVAPPQPPQLQLSKSADRTSAQIGDTITYTLTVGNVGAGPTTNVQLFDAIPTGTSFVGASNGGGFVSGGTIGWNLGPLNAGASTSVTLSVQVTNDAAASSSISNLAQVRSTEIPTLVPSNQGTPTGVTLVPPAQPSPPQLSVTKQADSANPAPGDLVTYTLTYSNAGPGTATNTQLTDNVPAGTTFSDAPGASFTGSGALWNLGPLQAGASGTRTFRVRVLNSTPSGTPITNTAQLDAAEVSPVSSNPVTITVRQPAVPQFQIQKTVSASSAQPNDVLTYSISFFNSGTGAATGVSVTDQLPPSTSFFAASPGGQAFGSTVFWNFSSVQPGQQGTVTLQVRINPGTPGGTQISNTARISSSELPNAQVSNFALTTVTQPPQPPLLTVSKQADVGSSARGGLINYTLTVNNSGGAATGVALTDAIPAGATGVIALDGGFISFGTAQWSLGPMTPGDTRQVHLRVQVNSNASGVISNTAQVQATGIAPVASNTVQVAVNVPPSFVIQKFVDKSQAAPGDQLRYDIGVRNAGTTTVTNARLTDNLPAGTQFLSATANASPIGGTLTWQITSLAPGQQASVTVLVRVVPGTPDGTQIANQATVSTSDQQFSQSSNVVTTTVSSPQVRLTLDKQVDKVAAPAGDTLTYTLVFANSGTQTFNQLQIVDPLPANTTFAGSDTGGQLVAGAVRFNNLPPVSPGATGSVSFRARINNGVAAGTLISNQGRIGGPELSQPILSDTVTTAVAAVPPAALTLSKQVDKATAAPGDTLTYTLTYSNPGQQAVSQVAIVDPIPQGASFSSADPGVQFTGTAVQLNVGTLAAGASGSFSFRVQINNGVAAGTQINNQGRIGSPQIGQPTLSNVVTTTVSSAQVRLTLDKQVDKASAPAGDTLTYTLTFANSGTQTFNQLQIVDPLPANTTFVGSDTGGQLVAGAVRFSLPPVSPGATGSVSFRARINPGVAAGTVISNQGRIGGSEVPQAILSDTVATAVAAAQPPAVLALSKQVDKATAAPGDTLTYTLTYSNPGQQAVSQVAIVDPIPQGTAFHAADPGVQFTGTAVQLNVGTLPAGASGSFSFQVRLNTDLTAGTQINNQGRIGSPQIGQPTLSNVVTTTVSSAQVRLTLDKQVDKANALAGDTLTYTLTFANSGTQTFNQLQIVDPLPANTTFGGSDTGGQLVAGAVRFSLPPVGPGATGSVSFRARINPGVAAGTVISNQGQIGGSGVAQPILSDTVTTAVAAPTPSPAALTLSKRVDKATAAPTDLLTYTLTYSNSGQQAVSQVTIVDPMPQGTAFHAADPGVQFTGDTVQLNVGTLPAGASGSFSFQVRLNNDLPAGTQVNNQGRISSPQLAQPVPSNTVTTTVGQGTPTTFAGTWFLVPSNDDAASLTVDPQNKLTVWAVSQDRTSVARWAQGTLQANGSFDLLSEDRTIQIRGQIAADHQSVVITALRAGRIVFPVTAPRAPDVPNQDPLPARLVGTWNGAGQAGNGDRLRVFLSVDPGGNSTFTGELVPVGAAARLRFAHFFVTPDGRLTDPQTNQEVGVMQVQGNQLVLTYNFQTAGPPPYQNTFQVVLQPLP
jgi:uncharacterized repeat protein (TIGR01451 family)